MVESLDEIGHDGVWILYTLDDGEVIIKECYSESEQQEVMLLGWEVVIGEDFEEIVAQAYHEIIDINEKGGIA